MITFFVFAMMLLGILSTTLSKAKIPSEEDQVAPVFAAFTSYTRHLGCLGSSRTCLSVQDTISFAAILDQQNKGGRNGSQRDEMGMRSLWLHGIW